MEGKRSEGEVARGAVVTRVEGGGPRRLIIRSPLLALETCAMVTPRPQADRMMLLQPGDALVAHACGGASNVLTS